MDPFCPNGGSVSSIQIDERNMKPPVHWNKPEIAALKNYFLPKQKIQQSRPSDGGGLD